VVTVVFNNNIFGWIKHVQKQYYRENYISTDFNHVDFATVARGFGARGYTANTIEELSDALAREARPEGPAVIDVNSDEWETPVLSRPTRRSGKIAVYK
jgi:thiamine pyrophosphate-dependent acetolactate synthase large subunit-like protein